MNNAIVSLIRGYTDPSSYDKLITRNLLLKENVTSKFQINIPYVFFHEGNISVDHQQYIKHESQYDNMYFIDISKTWNKDVRGYIAMCMFHSYDIWDYCKDFDYIMRVDDDCHIQECNQDPFSKIEQIGRAHV